MQRRLLLAKNRHEHVRPLLKTLHWLPVKDRIIFKIATVYGTLVPLPAIVSLWNSLPLAHSVAVILILLQSEALAIIQILL